MKSGRKLSRLVMAIVCMVAPTCFGASPDDPLIRVESVPITGATFVMGTPLKAGSLGYYDDESPITVTVENFRISQQLVTAAQFCRFLNSGALQKHHLNTICQLNHREENSLIRRDPNGFSPRAGMEEAPALFVTWKGAVLFCQWLSEETGGAYRLPSEGEWELAARGDVGRPWPWGEGAPTDEHGVIFSRKQARKSIYPPVGDYRANATPEGVYDMLAYYGGQWCANKYARHPTAVEAVATEVDLDDLASKRVVRGYYRKSGLRYKGPLGKVLSAAEIGWETTEGRPWTRIALPPLEYGGIRVVQE